MSENPAAAHRSIARESVTVTELRAALTRALTARRLAEKLAAASAPKPAAGGDHA